MIFNSNTTLGCKITFMAYPHQTTSYVNVPINSISTEPSGTLPLAKMQRVLNIGY